MNDHFTKNIGVRASTDAIRAALFFVDATDRDMWIQMGMAVKDEMGEAGFSLWDEWSQTAHNYQAKAAKSVWKSIKFGGKVTIGSLFYFASKAGYKSSSPYTPPSAEEQARLEAERTAARLEAEKIQQALQAKAKMRAADLWGKGRSVDAKHPYLVAKGIKPIGIKQKGNLLLVPVWTNQELTSLLIITENNKNFLTDGETKGGFMVIGELEGAAEALLCEGWATGCTLHQATGKPVIVAFSASNMATVADTFKKDHPGLMLTICAEQDLSGTGLKAAEKAAGSFGEKARICLPVFRPDQLQQYQEKHGKAPSDFNDLHQLAGIEEVSRQVLTEAVGVACSGNEEVTGSKEIFVVESSNVDISDEETEHSEEEDEVFIKHLAAMKELDYARARKEAAKGLGISVSMLDRLVRSAKKEIIEQKSEGAGGQILFETIEAWPTEVNGNDVLNAAYQLLSRYVIADKETLRAATLWVAMTWFVDYATVLPLAVITAPEKGCGKSSLLMALAKLVCRPLYSSNISPSALFRTMEAWKPSLLIDEADTFAKDNEELRGIINAGHIRETATIIRTVEIAGELQPRVFSVWGAKALAGIGNLPETIMSRAVILNMIRKAAGEFVENLRRADLSAFLRVKCQFARWADDCGLSFQTANPDMGNMSNRTADNWEPLFALADLAGGEWPMFARHAASKLNGDEEESLSVNEELLTDIRTIFDRKRTDRIDSSHLILALCEDEEAPWLTYNYKTGKPITQRQLSKRLSEFGIKPKNIKIGGRVLKGYQLEDFSDTFHRYLEKKGSQSATPLPAFNDGAFTVADRDLYPPENIYPLPLKPLPEKEGSGVADRTAKKAEKNEKVEFAANDYEEF